MSLHIDNHQSMGGRDEMNTSIIAALMSIISSPDICEVSTTYRGRVSTFCANHGAALYQAARVETPTLRLPILHYCACRWDYHSLMSQLDADNKVCDPWPERFLEALETVRLSGRTNMLDHPEVTRLTAEMGYPEVAEWLADHRREYAAFVLEGTRPLGKNFGGKEDPAPCADK